MNPIFFRLAAVALVALLPAACTAVAPSLTAVEPGGGGIRASQSDGADVPSGSDVTDEDPSERAWLRSVSTAPMRPRLASHLADAPAPTDLVSRNPRIRVDGVRADGLRVALEHPDVAFATSFFVGEVPLRSDNGRERVRVAFVHPGGFRVFTPRVTGAVEPLWRSIWHDEIALTFEAARRLELDPGSDVRIGRLGHRVDTRVSGLLSLGRAGVADAVASNGLMQRIDADAEPVMLVGVRRLADIIPVAQALEAASVGTVSIVADVEPYRAELVGDDEATVAAFEPFTFTHRGGGLLSIEQGWIDRNIAKAQVPVLGEVKCHRLLIPPLRAALTEIVEEGLADLVNADDYGGCWFPRHIGWDEHRSLSMHAWGLALDFNVQTNLMGQRPQMDRRVVEVFERHGFNWGGRWRVPDGMHFELGALPDRG